MQIKNTLVLFATAALVAGTADAATITYVGVHTNVETFADNPADGWRNASTAKLFDADGDNVIGTDGYDFVGSSTVISLPAYVASATTSGGHNDNNRGLVDNPLDPSGADIGLGWNGNGSTTLVFQGGTLAAETLRLAVLHDGTWNLGQGTQTFTLTQTAGTGSDSVTTPTLTLAGDGLDVAYFDIAGIQDGDTFSLTRTGVSIPWRHLAGVAFDTVIPEPSSLALLGLGGLMMIKRRRRG